MFNKPFLAQSGLEKQNRLDKFPAPYNPTHRQILRQRDVTLESGEEETILTPQHILSSADLEVGREERRKMSSLVNSDQRYKSNMLRMSQCYSYKVLESS